MPETTPIKRPILKWIAIAVMGILGLLLVTLIIGLLWIRSDSGRAFLEARIEGLEIAGQTVQIDGLEGSVLGAFEIDRVALSGRDGEWLVARKITVDWTPRALLSERLDVDALRVGKLDILQRPILVPSGSNDPSPISVFDIDGLDLPDVTITEAVLGRAVSLSAQGRVDHGPDGGSTVLTARSDRNDTLEADLTWSPLLVLDGDASVKGAPGGLIATLLRLDPEQSFSADVSTQGSVTDIMANVDGAMFADLAIERGQYGVSIVGQLDANRLPILASVAPFLGGTADIEARLPLDQGATARIDLRAPNLTVDATGGRSDGVITMDRVQLRTTRPLQSLGDGTISVETLVADGSVTIGESYRFDGTFAATDLAYEEYRVDQLSGPTRLTFGDGALDFDLGLTGRASSSVVARADGATLSVAGRLVVEDSFITLSRANIDLPGLKLRGSGTVGYGDAPTAEFTGRYDVDTSLFAEGPSARLGGQATIRQGGNGTRVTLTGKARNIQGLPEQGAALVGATADYSAQIRVRNGAITVPNFKVSNAVLDASGSARWQNDRLQADIAYTAESIDLDAISASTVSGTASASGPRDRIDFKADLSAETVSANGIEATNADLIMSGTIANKTIDSQVQVGGDTAQGRIDTTADVQIADGGWAVSNLQGNFGELSATGSFSGLGGDIAALRGDLVVSGTSPLIPAEQIQADITLSDAVVDVDARLSGINAGQLRDGEVRLLAKGPRSSVAFQLGVTGDTRVREVQRALVLDATGSADLSADILSGVTQFDLSVGDVGLSGKAAAERRAEGWAGSLDATGLGGTIVATVQAGDALDFDVTALSISQLAALMARPATEGTFSSTGRFAVLDTRVEGDAVVTLADLRSPISDAEAITVVSNVTLQNERLLVTTGATEGGLSGQAGLEGDVETLARFPYLVWPPVIPLQGSANLQGEIGPVVELFLPPQTDVAGRIDTDMDFTVPPSASGLRGRVTLTDGQFEQGALGLRLEAITLSAELTGDSVTVPSLSARGVDGGSLSGSGRMGLRDGTGAVTINAKRLQVVDRREGKVEVSGALNLSRTLELLKLGGELLVTDAELDIGRLPEPGLPTLDVDFGDVEEEDAVQSFASTTTELDISIVSNSQIAVKGRGLDADMSMNARVRGAFDAPVVTGTMTIDRGRFDFLSKRFDFEESSISLRENTMDSLLALEAVRRTPDLTAVVKIRGTLDRPEIELTSEPNLPGDEILSRILFGRSPTQLSAIETARLAAALTQLSGGSGFDLFGSLENAIGLDTLDIGQNETGQTELATGKYLSDKVYLEIRTTAQGEPGVAVEWQVRDNVSLEAETLSNERQRLSVQWKRDFD